MRARKKSGPSMTGRSGVLVYESSTGLADESGRIGLVDEVAALGRLGSLAVGLLRVMLSLM